MDVKFFKCAECESVSVKVYDPGTGLACCGKQMEELVANDTDGAREKHVPVVAVEGTRVHAEVGEVAHPMTEEHLITCVVLVTEKGFQVARLDPTDEPVADFVVVDGDAPLRVYEYCNLHGLWVKEL